MGENKDKKFINEKIIGREMTFKRALKNISVSILCGLFFGAAAFAALFFIKKEFDKRDEISLNASAGMADRDAAESAGAAGTVFADENEAAGDSAPADENIAEHGTEASGAEPKGSTAQCPEAETGTGASPEETLSENGTMASAEGMPGTEALGEDEIREIIASEREGYKYSSDDLKNMLDGHKEACELTASYIVTVDCNLNETTWFESTIETKRSYSGVIISKYDTEILILTVTGVGDNGGSLSVTFHDGTKQDAIIKKRSDRSSLMVVAVPTEGLGTDFVDGIKAIEYCGADSLVPGEPVIAAGAPLGAVGSFDFGFINYVPAPVNIVDGRMQCCLADVKSDTYLGTFITDLSGRLLGVASSDSSYNETNADGTVVITAASLSPIIESMKKGYDLPYLGIIGNDISFEMKYKNIPEGMYVTYIENASPAFNAGIRKGDIITAAGSREIKSSDNYRNFLKSIKPGDEFSVKIERAGAAEEYKELEITLTAGVR